MLKQFSPHTKRRTFVALMCLAPLLLFAIIREKRSWQPRTLPTEFVYDVEWMADCKTIVVRAGDALQLWDTTKEVLIRSHQFKPKTYTFAPTLLPEDHLGYQIRNDQNNEHRAVIEDLTTGKQLFSLALNDEWPTFASDGKRLCIITEKREIKIYQINPFRQLHTGIIKPPANMTFLTYDIAPNLTVGAVLCFGTQNNNPSGVLLFDVKTGKILSFLSPTSLPQSDDFRLSFSSDSQTLVIAGSDAVQLRDAKTGRLNISIHYPPNKFMSGAGARWLFPSSNKHWLFCTVSRSIFVWDATTGQLLREIKVNDHITSLLLSPDQRTLAVGTGKAGKNKGSIQLYRMR